MFYLPRTHFGQATLLSAGLVGLFLAGTAVSATQQMAAAKADRLPIVEKADPACSGQTWPNIAGACLERISTGDGALRPVRTITVERRVDPNTSILMVIPVTEQADAR